MCEPPIEFGRSGVCARIRHERLIAQFDSEIQRVGIRDDLSGVSIIFKNSADELVQIERGRAGNLDRPSDGIGQGGLCYCSRDVASRHWLEQRMRQAYLFPRCCGLGDAAKEFEELCGADK